MNIGAISSNIMDVGNGLGAAENSSDIGGSFFQDVERALSTMNTVSLKEEQDALDLDGVNSAVVSLIMSFYASGGNVIELQDAQAMTDIILGSDAMLDLLSYNEVTLNDIFLSNLNGGVLSGSDNLMDKINNMDFSQIICAIKDEVSSDINIDDNMSQLIVKIMNEIQSGTNQKIENTHLNEANVIFDVVGKIRVDGEDTLDEAVIKDQDISQILNKEDSIQDQETIIKTGHDDRNNHKDRIHVGKKTDYSGDVKNRTDVTKVNDKNAFGMSSISKLERAEITLERPIESAGLANSVLEIMQTSITNGNNSLFIKLKPDFLGGIAIKLAMSEGGVVAKIVTTSERTQNMLASQLTNLESTLKDKGIDVARMEVLYNPLNQDGQGQSNKGHREDRGNSSRSFVIEDSEDDASLQYLQLIGEDEELEEGVYNA